MGQRQDHIRLGGFLSGAGSHFAGWRHPSADRDAAFNIQRYVNYAKTLERGCFDALFLNDNFELGDLGAKGFSRNTHTSRWDPMTLLTALSMVTNHIGLVATVNTSYNEPFNVARRFASLDQLSGGRAGWNLVTSLGGGENFNRTDHLPHQERYARAEEFFDVVTKLWDSWDDNAFLRDPVSGQWVDPAKLHLAQHQGECFSVRGPLNTPRPPQGWPVIAQAGSSGEGLALAARAGELIFTAQQTLPAAQAFYQKLKDQAIALGRSANDVLILPGVATVVAHSRVQAEEKYEELQALLDPVMIFSSIIDFLDLGVDLTSLPLDAKVPLPKNPPLTQGHQSRQQLVIDLIHRDRPTVRELLRKLASGGHRTIVGTASDIADDFEHWFHHYGADGFNIMFTHLPTAADDFVNLVVPELQRRGLLRTAYEGKTLRDHLGLKRVENKRG
ncbi:LLM class flavin-dependent oxidoreductase [Aquirhabdus parva]|uniref:LLM class flavin-dependent oxidoreductase n=1 Tax=Aquirhabdus parva TaxID=2283318 RepID=UPI001AEA6582|nr:LLM class flavin-dependent oxidoreductase [Aquirhabdus parva]